MNQIQLLELLANSKELIANSLTCKNFPIVAFLGNTGGGKSTLINFLLGHVLILNPDTGSIDIPNQIIEKYAMIGHKMKSTTKAPQIYQIGDLILLDTPGFQDNGGKNDEILASIGIRAAMKCSKSIRLVLVIEWNSIIADRGKGLSDLVKTMSSFIKTGYDITPNALLVITKTNLDRFPPNIERIRKKLKELLQLYEKQKSNEFGGIVEFLMQMTNENSRIFICDPLNQEHRISILTHIDKLKPLTHDSLMNDLDEILNKFAEQLIHIAINKCKDLQTWIFNHECILEATKEIQNHETNFQQSKDKQIKEIEVELLQSKQNLREALEKVHQLQTSTQEFVIASRTIYLPSYYIWRPCYEISYFEMPYINFRKTVIRGKAITISEFANSAFFFGRYKSESFTESAEVLVEFIIYEKDAPSTRLWIQNLNHQIKTYYQRGQTLKEKKSEVQNKEPDQYTVKRIEKLRSEQEKLKLDQSRLSNKIEKNYIEMVLSIVDLLEFNDDNFDELRTKVDKFNSIISAET